MLTAALTAKSIVKNVVSLAAEGANVAKIIVFFQKQTFVLIYQLILAAKPYQ